jgi:hypothetical protein
MLTQFSHTLLHVSIFPFHAFFEVLASYSVFNFFRSRTVCDLYMKN